MPASAPSTAADYHRMTADQCGDRRVLPSGNGLS